jgi:uncharacterized protein
MHHDAIHFFPLPMGSDSSTRGLLAINHEYADDGLLHVGGMEPWTAEKVAKSQAAHGVSIIEVAFEGGHWVVVRPSTYARRITGRTPILFSGPAAGHGLLQTAADPAGTTVIGTLNNCAHGVTPWGTYLTCEENFNGYFANLSGNVEGVADGEQKLGILKGQSRYGIAKAGAGYRWHEHDERFDASRHPNEPNRFGWVVEVDPFDPQSQAVKHTALGRFKHEGAWVTLGPDNHVVVYMGDDQRNEYIYKFISEGAYTPESRAANMRLLERGTLHAARFNPDGSGEWLPLVQGQHGLDAAAGFPSQAEVLINARAAADIVGATKMDRPEWIAVHPTTKEVYCTLTNNTDRGTDKGPAVDAANPRANNVYGHIIHWREQGGDPRATHFAWDVFVLCGDPSIAEGAKHGTIQGDIFGSPDGLWFDARGVLWIQRHLGQRAEQGRLCQHREQPDARRRSEDPGNPPLPHRAQRLRGNRGRAHPERSHHIRQHPAPWGNARGAQRSDEPHGGERVATWRPLALGDGGDPQGRRRDHRHLSAVRVTIRVQTNFAARGYEIFSPRTIAGEPCRWPAPCATPRTRARC